MEFCPTVVWPVIPVWVMETMVVDMKLLEMKARREGVDLVSEFNVYEEAKYRDYVQLYTDGSKDPETRSTGAAVAVPSHRWGICRRTSNFKCFYHGNVCHPDGFGMGGRKEAKQGQ